MPTMMGVAWALTRGLGPSLWRRAAAFDASKFYRGTDGQLHWLAPHERGVRAYKGMMPGLLKGGFVFKGERAWERPEERRLVAEARAKTDQEMRERRIEDLKRRQERHVKLAQARLRKLQSGFPETKADHAMLVSEAWAVINGRKKEFRVQAQETTKMENRIKMARLRARRRT